MAELPQNLDAEQSLLGAIILGETHGRSMFDTIDLLKPEDFVDRRNKLIYGAIKSVIQNDGQLDYTTIANELKRQRIRLTEQYWNTILDKVPTAAHVQGYLDIVLTESLRRRYIELGQQLKTLGFNSELKIEELTKQANMVFDNLTNLSLIHI